MQFFIDLLSSLFALAGQLIRGLLGAPVTAAKGVVQGVEIRRARVDELIAVRHAVLREGRPESTAHLTEDHDPLTRHWAAERLGIVIGVVSVMSTPDKAQKWQLRGMAVLPQYRGQGLGDALLQAVQHEVHEPMWCNARTSAEGFYAKNGWTSQGDVFDIAPVGPHRLMTWLVD